MTFVVIRPNSNTNQSKDFLVVDSAAWARYADGETASLGSVERVATNEEAEAIRDRLNNVTA
ncbi:hypothetical protein [Streptomyces sp. NPDC017448]|uniref:hypothetical protein n=1 Tax=Streptomyces sp. NPDC017448 TaxID=3364996 RepID=UPI00379BD48A